MPPRRSSQSTKSDRPPLSMRAAAMQAVRILQDAGHVAYFAGGCVRDMLRGKRPDDYDVATSAEPKQVVALFRRTQQVGAKFGVILVRMGSHAIETATFRSDGDYGDGRRPTTVCFTDARHDAERRDFTINGMFYDPVERKVIDFVDGQGDLKNGVIRAIGEPERRFAEDHLRLLRAVRFASRLKFKIHPATWTAMCKHAPAICRISPERIRGELELMFVHAGRAAAFDLLHRSGVLVHLWQAAKELRGHEPAIAAWMAQLPTRSSFELCMAVLLHAISNSQVGRTCDALRCSNDTRRIVTWLHARQNALAEPDRLSLADLKRLMAHEAYGDLISMFAAKLRAEGQSLTPYRGIMARARAIAPSDVAPEPLFDGNDLAGLDVPRGPIYKKILDKVYDAQLNEEITNRAAARRYVLELLQDR